MTAELWLGVWVVVWWKCHTVLPGTSLVYNMDPWELCVPTQNKNLRCNTVQKQILVCICPPVCYHSHTSVLLPRNLLHLHTHFQFIVLLHLSSQEKSLQGWGQPLPLCFLLSDSGAAEIAVTVPDSITDWRAMTFCTSESHGLGISETTSLQSFKPFFVEPTLPYSVFRGESFPLKVKVFSYLKQCMAVSDSLQDGFWAG